jgi:DNA-directed RNA polymerase specialized sigma24 family protein
MASRCGCRATVSTPRTWSRSRAPRLLPFHTFHSGTNFKAWDLRIVTSCFFSNYQKKKRQLGFVDRRVVAGPPHADRGREAGHGRRSAATLLNKLDTGQVAAIISARPEEYRIVCVPYFVDDPQY